MTMQVSGTTGWTFPDNSTQATAATGFGFKNRIINGAMMIDQRNAGASTSSGGYNLDRWYFDQSQSSKATVQQNAASVTPPAGFSKYLGFTSSSAYSVLSSDYFGVFQAIEGQNMSDFGWGAVGATSITISFWVRSSLTGTFGGAVTNSAQNRSYPFTYTISVANTWEQKSITIAGDTTGTWLTTNGVGMYVYFSMGMGSTKSGTANTWAAANYYSATGATSVVGTSGATFYITGVQLEKGSTATSFDYRPYGTELALCQRYYQQIEAAGSAGDGAGLNDFYIVNANVFSVTKPFKVTMRTGPTVTASIFTSSGFNTGTFGVNSGNVNGFRAYCTANATGNGYFLANWYATAEL